MRHKSERRQLPPILRATGGSAVARMAILPVNAVLGIVSTRLIIDNYGQGAYAQYMLLIGIASLIPFADLGLSASVMNATAGAKNPRSDDHLRRTLVSCMRILAGSSVTLMSVSVVLLASGSWPSILGSGLMGDSGPRAATACLMILGLSLTVSYGQRLLIGLGQNHLSILIGGLQTPLVLLLVFATIRFNLPAGGYLAVFSYVGILLIGGLSLVAANRQVRPIIAESSKLALRVRTERGERVFSTAWPMLIQMIALPIAMQTDRLILSHVSDVEELARYSLTAQIFNPIWAVAIAAGMALWPIFAKDRANADSSSTSPHRLSLVFAAAAAAACLMMAVCSGFLSDLASGGTIEPGRSLVVAYSVFIVLQAAKYPLGMYMTDERGLKFQAYMVLLMVPVNFGLSWYLAGRWGAIGPVLGSIVGVMIFQQAANWVYVGRRRTQEGT